MARIQKCPHLVETAHAFAPELENSRPASCQDLHPFPVHSEQGQGDQREMNHFSDKNNLWAYQTLRTINLNTLQPAMAGRGVPQPRTQGIVDVAKVRSEGGDEHFE